MTVKTNLLHIKNMVCPRCVEAVHNLLERAGYRVGYGSASQFSREYARMYGAPPARDAARLRAGGLETLAA